MHGEPPVLKERVRRDLPWQEERADEQQQRHGHHERSQSALARPHLDNEVNDEQEPRKQGERLEQVGHREPPGLLPSYADGQAVDDEAQQQQAYGPLPRPAALHCQEAQTQIGARAVRDVGGAEKYHLFHLAFPFVQAEKLPDRLDVAATIFLFLQPHGWWMEQLVHYA